MYREECSACREVRRARRLRRFIEGVGVLFLLAFVLALAMTLGGCGGSEEDEAGYTYGNDDAARADAERICQAYTECLGTGYPACADDELRRAGYLCVGYDPGCVEQVLAPCAACYIERGCGAWVHGVPVEECMRACRY